MDEHASFETRAVLAPRRARLNRVVLVLPVVALVVIAGVGLSGPHSDQATVRTPDPAAVAVASPTAEATNPPPPGQVVGLDVHRLADVQPQALGRDDVVALVGWYVATGITDCPPIAAIYRQGALPDVRGDADALAFCVRTGVLYASPPDIPSSSPEVGGLPSVPVTVVVGVVMPPKLEAIGPDATEVVVLARFVPSASGCLGGSVCTQELLVDHVAWTPDG